MRVDAFVPGQPLPTNGRKEIPDATFTHFAPLIAGAAWINPAPRVTRQRANRPAYCGVRPRFSRLRSLPAHCNSR